jgi:serine/threonine-protein kinase
MIESVLSANREPTSLAPARFMSTQSVPSLLDVLRRHQLLDAASLAELDRLAPRFFDAESLAADLIKRGWLTPYQVNQLMKGKGQELVLGSYIILEQLGEGGMGQVLKARHRNMGRIVALKIIREERLKRPDALRRFQREVRAVAALNHPHIVHAYDADQIGNTHLLVMEYIEGAIDLARLVKKNGPLPVDQACEYIRQAALGLQHAFERGLVHRDIKPANLLLTIGGKVLKVLDMGLARLDPIQAINEQSSVMTQVGSIMGTPDFIAPEQAMDSHTVDTRADLYSLGCTLYYLLTGRAPFAGGTMMEKLMKQQLEEPRPVEQFRPEVPTGVAIILRKLMAKKPQNRYQTPAELVTALTPWCSAASAYSHALSATPLPVLDKSQADSVKEGSRDTLDSALSYIDKRDDTIALESSTAVRLKKGMPRWLLYSSALGTLLCLAVLLGFFFFHRAKEGRNQPGEKDRSQTKVAKKIKPSKEEEQLRNATALLGGKWYYIGPFDNLQAKGFHTVYPPEKEINLKAVYPGKNDQPVKWNLYADFDIGIPLDFLPLFPTPQERTWACVYLYHEMYVSEATSFPVSLGSDDTLTVWLNDQRLIAKNVWRGVQKDDEFTILKLKPGRNKLLVKICQGIGAWGFYISPVKDSALPFYLQPSFDPWCRQVAGLTAEKQIEAVVAKLKELNPRFDGQVTKKIEKDVVMELVFNTDNITDISPVRPLTGLKILRCTGSGDGRSKLHDLSPLAGLPLTELSCGSTQIADLSPLKGMQLTYLFCGHSRAFDLSPLKGMPLKYLHCGYSYVSDLSPLKDCPLTMLECHRIPVSDLSPLEGMQLTLMHCHETSAPNLWVLKGMPLKKLLCDFNPYRDSKMLRSIDTLESIDWKPARVFWNEVDARQAAIDAWCKQVADMPIEKQVPAVAAKLKEVNPGFDGTVTHKKTDDAVTELQFVSDRVTQLWPVRALAGLKKLDCSGTQLAGKGNGLVSDLYALKGMQLTSLNCSWTKVADLSPLTGMPLTVLHCAGAGVNDLTPLREMPLLKELRCDFKAERDGVILRDMTFLESINGKLAKEFWK